MQVKRLPTSIHKVLDKYVRRCVWGEFNLVKKVLRVSWDVLCKSRERGGFGLRRAEGMNMALLTKLCWRMLTQSDSMWARTLIKKYDFNMMGPVVFKHKHRVSTTWRGLDWSSKLLSKGLRWKVVDG